MEDRFRVIGKTMKRDMRIYRSSGQVDFAKAAASWEALINAIVEHRGLFESILGALGAGKNVERLLVLGVELEAEGVDLASMGELLGYVGRAKKIGIEVEGLLRGAIEERVSEISRGLGVGTSINESEQVEAVR